MSRVPTGRGRQKLGPIQERSAGPQQPADGRRRHQVARGDTFGSIGEKYFAAVGEPVAGHLSELINDHLEHTAQLAPGAALGKLVGQTVELPSAEELSARAYVLKKAGRLQSSRSGGHSGQIQAAFDERQGRQAPSTRGAAGMAPPRSQGRMPPAAAKGLGGIALPPYDGSRPAELAVTALARAAIAVDGAMDGPTGYAGAFLAVVGQTANAADYLAALCRGADGWPNLEAALAKAIADASGLGAGIARHHGRKLAGKLVAGLQQQGYDMAAYVFSREPDAAQLEIVTDLLTQHRELINNVLTKPDQYSWNTLARAWCDGELPGMSNYTGQTFLRSLSPSVVRAIVENELMAAGLSAEDRADVTGEIIDALQTVLGGRFFHGVRSQIVAAHRALAKAARAARSDEEQSRQLFDGLGLARSASLISEADVDGDPPFDAQQLRAIMDVLAQRLEDEARLAGAATAPTWLLEHYPVHVISAADYIGVRFVNRDDPDDAGEIPSLGWEWLNAAYANQVLATFDTGVNLAGRLQPLVELITGVTDQFAVGRDTLVAQGVVSQFQSAKALESLGLAVTRVGTSAVAPDVFEGIDNAAVRILGQLGLRRIPDLLAAVL